MPHPQHLTTCISSLPSEINHRIFSSFSKQECLECMLVCRQWRKHMATWSVDQWRSIRLSNDDLDQLSPLLSLVGSSVRHMVVVQPSQKSIIKVMHSLIHLGMTRLSTFSKYQWYYAMQLMYSSYFICSDCYWRQVWFGAIQYIYNLCSAHDTFTHWISSQSMRHFRHFSLLSQANSLFKFGSCSRITHKNYQINIMLEPSILTNQPLHQHRTTTRYHACQSQDASFTT